MAEQIPRDIRVVRAIERSLGADPCDFRATCLLAEFQRTEISETLAISLQLAHHSSRTAVEANDAILGSSIRATRIDQSTEPQQTIFSLASEVNSVPFPLMPNVLGPSSVELPPVDKCTLAVNYSHVPMTSKE